MQNPMITPSNLKCIKSSLWVVTVCTKIQPYRKWKDLLFLYNSVLEAGGDKLHRSAASPLSKCRKPLVSSSPLSSPPGGSTLFLNFFIFGKSQASPALKYTEPPAVHPKRPQDEKWCITCNKSEEGYFINSWHQNSSKKGKWIYFEKYPDKSWESRREPRRG